MNECTILSPLGILGYGIPKDSITRAVENYDVDVIASDAGSVDPGPNYLGMGKSFTEYDLVKRDLGLVLEARQTLDVPLLIGTSGGSGARVHVDWLYGILEELVREEGFTASTARIYTDVDRSYVRNKRERGNVSELDYHVKLTDDRLAETTRMVAQVGHEPFVEALEAGADVVLGGRASDIAPFSAVPRRDGFDPGLSGHLGKILECGAHATESGTGADSLIGILRDDHFEVEPPNPNKRCTTESVAAHTLYEKANPNRIHLPDGYIDVTDTEFEQSGDRRVSVRGSRFVASGTTSVLVEGVRKSGSRTIAVAGVRDPTTIEHLDEIVEGIRSRVDDVFHDRSEDYDLTVRRYGIDGVPLYDTDDEEDDRKEVGLILDVLARDQEFADAVCGMARSTLLHQPFEGRTATGGNLAFPYSPSDISVGDVYEFSVYHLLEDVDQGTIADIRMEEHQ